MAEHRKLPSYQELAQELHQEARRLSEERYNGAPVMVIVAGREHEQPKGTVVGYHGMEGANLRHRLGVLQAAMFQEMRFHG